MKTIVLSTLAIIFVFSTSALRADTWNIAPVDYNDVYTSVPENPPLRDVESRLPVRNYPIADEIPVTIDNSTVMCVKNGGSLEPDGTNCEWKTDRFDCGNGYGFFCLTHTCSTRGKVWHWHHECYSKY